ncbi:hypothetical protein ABPG75_007617 [Micractinium tetrahymenae]
MIRLLHTPAGVSDFAPAAAAKAMPAAPCCPADPASAKAVPQPAHTDAAADGWSIGAAGTVCRHATACTPPEHAPACMDFAVTPPEASCTALAAGPSTQAIFTLDLELTAEEAVCLVQTLAPPAAIPAPRPAAAALQAARSLPRRLRHAATSLGAAGSLPRRLHRAATSLATAGGRLGSAEQAASSTRHAAARKEASRRLAAKCAWLAGAAPGASRGAQ